MGISLSENTMGATMADASGPAYATPGALPGVLPPIDQVRGADYPDATSDPKKKVEWVERLQRESEVEAIARYKQATHHLLYANNRQWISWETHRKTWEDLPNGANEIRVTINYIKPMLRARAARLLSGEVNWRVTPKSNAYRERDKANVAITFLRSRYDGQDLHHVLRRGLSEAFCTGAVALKSFWNPNIGPLTCATIKVPGMDPRTGMPTLVDQYVNEQGQPVQTKEEAFHYRPGDTDTSLRSIFHLRMNPEAHGWTEAEGFRWLIDSDVVPLSVAKEKFPHVAAEIRASQSNETGLNYERIAMGSTTSRQFGATATQVPAAQRQTPMHMELTTIREYWEGRSPYFPSGRLIVSVGGALAYDGPWPQGILPYAPLFDEPGTMSPWGRACVSDMVSPQNVINREWTAVVEEMSVSGVGQFVAWNVPGVPEQITSEKRAVIRIPAKNVLANRPISDVFKRLDPAQVAPDRWKMIEQAKLALFDIGAFHEVTRGQIPPGLDSGVAIERLLESEAGQLKEAVDALKRTILMWSRHQLAIARWGYGENEQRWLPVEREDLGFMVENVSGLDLPDPEELDLDLEYFRPQSEAAMRAEVKELLQFGMLDPRVGLKLLDLGRGIDGAFASQTRHYARARTENLAFERGEVQPVMGEPTVDPMSGMVVQGPPTYVRISETGEPVPLHLPGHDDDLIHIDVHQEVALDESKPWAVRQLVLAHIEEHQMKLAEVAAMQAMAQQDPNGDPDAEGNDGPPQ